jgi:diphthamide synthase (EF-2-diphthine--ammonia ligase)
VFQPASEPAAPFRVSGNIETEVGSACLGRRGFAIHIQTCKARRLKKGRGKSVNPIVEQKLRELINIAGEHGEPHIQAMLCTIMGASKIPEQRDRLVQQMFEFSKRALEEIRSRQ